MSRVKIRLNTRSSVMCTDVGTMQVHSVVLRQNATAWYQHHYTNPLTGEGISVMMLISQWPVRLVYNHVDGSR